jgi:hypothetical protein
MKKQFLELLNSPLAMDMDEFEITFLPVINEERRAFHKNVLS